MNTCLTIVKKSDEHYVFTYFKNKICDDIINERNFLVRLMDEAVDALMYMPQAIVSQQLIGSVSEYQITLKCGDLEADK